MMETVLNEKEKELVNLISECDVNSHVSRILVYLANVEETTSRELERAVYLRQPEVSLAMKEIRNRGWAIQRNIPQEGKGRPTHGYSLSKPFMEIIGEIEEDIDAKINRLKQSKVRLKMLCSDVF